MKFWTNRLILTIVIASSQIAHAQDAQNPQPSIDPFSVTVPEKPDRPRAGLKFVYLGFRVRASAANVLADGAKTPNYENTAAQTTATFSTTSTTGRFQLGPVLEVPFGRRFSLLGEAYFQHVNYQKVTTTYKGIDNIVSTAIVSTVTERTKATYWDFPVLLRYRRLKDSGWLKRAFLEAGGIARLADSVKTGTDTLLSDSTTAYNEIPAVPASRRVFGTVIGAGFRFVDDFNIKAIPEVRYTLWNKRTFDSQSTQSNTRQLEIGFSIEF